ncbi:MAG: hypothetical protein AAF318_14360 [Pseudomonadota bacterium]
MTRFDRAAIVAVVVGIAFFALFGGLAWQGGMTIPLVLGVGLKGVLALGFAAVMAMAGRLERRRLQRTATIVRLPEPMATPDRMAA